MTDAGFFKGTSAEQDSRFSDKEMKLLRTLKFPPEFSEKVDMRKVNLQVMRPWIANKVTELVGFEDEVVVEYAMGLLEDPSQPTPDPRKMQINLTGFLTAKTPEFMIALWKLLLEAQASPGGIPKTFVEEKKEEMRRAREKDLNEAEEEDEEGAVVEGVGVAVQTKEERVDLGTVGGELEEGDDSAITLVLDLVPLLVVDAPLLLYTAIRDDLQQHLLVVGLPLALHRLGGEVAAVEILGLALIRLQRAGPRSLVRIVRLLVGAGCVLHRTLRHHVDTLLPCAEPHPRDVLRETAEVRRLTAGCGLVVAHHRDMVLGTVEVHLLGVGDCLLLLALALVDVLLIDLLRHICAADVQVVAQVAAEARVVPEVRRQGAGKGTFRIRVQDLLQDAMSTVAMAEDSTTEEIAGI
ncbi:hypothetical protein A7U60_g2232 [Sanghuangporus baumii]|uniref:PWI domain-containing protein n=1 Tax=Sanghuangporus baumii TaxID=108892 RepID=A0A9Q5I2Z0_SANBA|nr:hypothetical protein A7U60_g2232 [Sanghuangporus baumii]